MRIGRGRTSGLVALALLAAIAGEARVATAQPATPSAPAPAKPGVVVGETTSTIATVDAVDVVKRRLTATGPRGRTVTLKVGPGVKNLDQLKPGDQLVVRFFESVVVFLRKSSEPPAPAERAVVTVASRGKNPDMVVVDTVELGGKVESVDEVKRRITLKAPEGKTRTIKVDSSVHRFGEIRRGDQVVLRYTEAVAFSVRKP